MDAKAMLERFEVLAEAPGGVARVRQLVLELAVRGRLVAQEAGDEPASVLLERIAKERARLVAEKKIAKADPLPPVSEGERPYEVPEGWAWARLGSVTLEIEAGWSPSCEARTKSGEEWGVLKVSAVSWGTFLAEEHKALPSGVEPRPEYEVRVGDFLMSRANTAELVGRSVVVKETPSRLMLSDKVLRVYLGTGVDPHFINLCNLSSASRRYCAERASGTSTSMRNISRETIVALPLALPALAEQRRIVAQVDALMAWCDQLERRLADRDARREGMRDVMLGKIAQPPLAEARAVWTRAAASWPALVQRAEDVPTLRRAVLELAVRGRLVAQEPSDEPASALLARIAVERARLVAEKKIPKSEPLSPVGEGERPYELPEGWAWTRLGDVVDVAGGLQKSPQRRPDKHPVPYLRVANVQRGRLDLSVIEQFEIPPDELDRWRLRAGDLLVIEGNGSADEIGRCAIWDGSIDPCVHQNHVIRCRPAAQGIERYVEKFINSPVGAAVMRSLAITTSGLLSLSVGKIRTIVFPVPPLAEQRRIVAQVDALMALCDRLEASLRAQRAGHEAVAAAFARALAGASPAA